jgi:predicted short-subunit dehydrogenase-like oxidoreductase (DUF2520 family)
MNISFIGAGAVGTALGLYLKKHNIKVVGYYSKTYNSALNASELTETKAFKSLNELINVSKFIFITTNDNAISEVANNLSKLIDSFEGYIVAHTSGALTTEVLDELEKKGALTFSIHPLQTFVDPKVTCDKLSNTMFAIEGNKDIDVIKKLLDSTNNNYTVIDKLNKPLYHAGACIVSNYLVTLLKSGFKLFKEAGFREEDIFDSIEPLIMGTLNNIKSIGIDNALTGPLARGDSKTIKNHINNINDRELNDFYKYMGLQTLELINNGLDYKEIESILQGENDYE